MANEFIYPLRIHIEDTDFSGLVYHGNYIKFMERARSEWAEQLGFGIAWQKEQGIILLVRSITIDYLKPAQLHQLVEVVSKLREVRPASLIYEQYLREAKVNDNILCTAEIKLACVNRNLRACPLPKTAFLSVFSGEHE